MSKSPYETRTILQHVNHLTIKKNRTVAQVLFNIHFLCRIPQNALYNEDFYKTIGIPVMTDRKVNRALANEMSTVRLTPIEMVNYYKDGYEPIIVEDRDVAIIYTLFKFHLNAWEHHPDQKRFNEIIEDLKVIDQFAAFIYQRARAYEDQMPVVFGQTIENNRRQITRTMARYPEEKKTIAIKDLEHKPITRSLSKENFERTRSWR